MAPARAADGGKLPFSVPAGFVAERVAGPPLLKHPMFACFDDRGRLYVASSSGRDLDAAARLKDPPDLILRLEDADGDGRFDKSVVFADRLTYPQGVLWHDGAIFTASPPGLWRLEDTDGDGVADRRRQLVKGFPFTGIADDLHGPCLGPDGRIYWGVGRFDYVIRVPDGPVIRRGKAPLIMRCRPDGGEVEVFCAAMGNPVEVAFSPDGEPFACGTFLAPEAQGRGMRDAIIHCVLGGVYSVRDRSLIEDKRTGDPLPPLVHLGVAAGSGLSYDRAGVLGGGRPTLFGAMFNLHGVERYRLQRDGATFRARAEEFLTSEEPDFHPTDVLEDADGSLLVVDTGGWFRSCPTSQIDKPDVLGAIYRVRRRGAPVARDPRGLGLDWDGADARTLAGRLDDGRFAVRDRAVQELARRGDASVPALRDALEEGPPRARLGAVWALSRIDGPGARAANRAALDDRDAQVRLAATTAVGLRRDAEALPRLLALVDSGAPPVRREAASALGRLGRVEAVPALLGALRNGGDRFLEHALIRALIAIDDRGRTLPGLADPSPRVRRGALIALDQMDGGGLTPDLVTPLLDPAEPDLQEAALRVIVSRPDWAGTMVEPLRRWLAQGGLDEARRDDLRRGLLAFGKDPGVQGVVASALGDPSTPVENRVLLLETIARMPPDRPPPGWLAGVGRALGDRDGRVVGQAVATIRALGVADFDAALLRLARDPSRPDDLRVQAIAAAAPRLPRVGPESLAFLTSFLAPERPPLLRLEAARVLGQVPLDEAQRGALVGEVAAAGPLTLPRLLPAFERPGDGRLGAALVAALERSPGLAGLTPEALRRAFARYPEEVRRASESLARRLDVDVEAQAARLARLEPQLDRGNPRQGREVFFGTRAACSTCHAISGEGGRVGPDLSRIGAVRSRRDLLEAILYPSASFARGFEPHVVATHDGRVFSGIIVRETAARIFLVTGDRVEQSLPRSEIEAIEPSRVSVMPRGLDANLSRRELADLIAYLRSLR